MLAQPAVNYPAHMPKHLRGLDMAVIEPFNGVGDYMIPEMDPSFLDGATIGGHHFAVWLGLPLLAAGGAFLGSRKSPAWGAAGGAAGAAAALGALSLWMLYGQKY